MLSQVNSIRVEEWKGCKAQRKKTSRDSESERTGSLIHVALDLVCVELKLTGEKNQIRPR